MRTALLVFYFFFSLKAHARWATLEDAPAVSEREVNLFTVHKDGTWDLTHENIKSIRNEEGRAAYGLETIQYNARASKVRDLECYTQNGDEKMKVDSRYIEDKSLASSAEGFDDTRQISIAYPKVSVGSRLFMKFSQKTTEVPIPGSFSTQIVYGTELYEEHSQTIIESELPLFVVKNDPTNKLKITESKKGNRHVLQIDLSAPIYTKPIEEDTPLLSARLSTWVVISSNQQYQSLAEVVADEYEAVINSNLPPTYEKIFAKAKAIPSGVAQINAVTSLLADEVRYLGDWRPTRGGHIPRALEIVASTRFGDCKDFSASTAAILRKLGYQAHVAWVERTKTPQPLPKLAYDGAFNHAIVFAEKDGQTYWLDATNFQSFAQGLFEDIAGRDALIIQPYKSRLQPIPTLKAPEGRTELFNRFKFTKNGDAWLETSMAFKGRNAVNVTGATRQISKESVEHLVAKAVSDNGYVESFEFKPFDLSSRIVSDVKIEGTMRLRNVVLKTSAGRAYVLTLRDLKRVLELEAHKRVSDFYLSTPTDSETRTRLVSVNQVGSEKLNCRVDSPWITVERKVKKDKTGVEIVQTGSVKTAIIPIEAIRSPAFESFQRQLYACFSELAIVFR